MRIEIKYARESDAKRLAEVYNLSFYGDFLKYGECPGYNKTEASMLTAMKTNQVYKITAENIIAGALSIKKGSDTHYFLSALCVIPQYANKGIGQQAMHFIEKEFPSARHWALETPADKIQNHYFYEKFGFTVMKEYAVGSVNIALFERWM